MDFGLGLGIAIPLGSPGGVQTVHNEMIGYSFLQLTIINRNKYVLSVNGNQIGWWQLHEQATMMGVLQHWRGYLHNGGTYEAWLETAR